MAICKSNRCILLRPNKLKGRRRIFGCVLEKPLICIRTAKVQRGEHPSPEIDHDKQTLA